MFTTNVNAKTDPDELISLSRRQVPSKILFFISVISVRTV